MRIVSLLPSATEIICEIGLGEHLVGVSHECDYPNFVSNLPVVTTSLIPKNISSLQIDTEVRTQLSSKKALYHLKMNTLKELKPDFIVTQSLCEVCAVAEDEVLDAICHLPGNVKIINLEPMSLKDVFDTLLLVGEKTDFISQANAAVRKLTDRVQRVEEITAEKVPLDLRHSVVFLEWLTPPFNAGHWTPELIEYAGGNSLLSNKHQPSTMITWEDIRDSDADILFIACCGFNLDRTLKDIDLLTKKNIWHQLNAVKQNNVYVTDGNAFFSRPGPRLVDSLEIMAHTLHQEIHHLPAYLSPAYQYGAN